jgi:flagellar hook-associated protein 3 FlgL
VRPIGVPNILQAQRLSAATSSLRQQSETARAELVTGRIADLPSSLGGAIGEAFSLRGAIDAIGVRRQGLKQAALVAGVVQRSLSRSSEGAKTLASDALAANGRRDDAALSVSASEARTRVQSVFSSLNARVAGQSIFAGDASDRPALAGPDQLITDVAGLYAVAPSGADFDAALDSYFNDPAGGFSASVFTGGAGDAPSIEVEDGERLQFAIRADDGAIRDLLRGLVVIAVAGTAPASTLRDEALAAAANDALGGADALAARQADIGVAEARAANALIALDAEETALTEAYNGRTARDPFEAAARLQSLETQLSSAFAVTARLSQLSLATFLR